MSWASGSSGSIGMLLVKAARESCRPHSLSKANDKKEISEQNQFQLHKKTKLEKILESFKEQTTSLFLKQKQHQNKATIPVSIEMHAALTKYRINYVKCEGIKHKSE